MLIALFLTADEGSERAKRTLDRWASQLVLQQHIQQHSVFVWLTQASE